MAHVTHVTWVCSDDGKMLVAACGLPRPGLCAWHLSSGKLAGHCPLPGACTALTCRPGSSTCWATAGEEGLRVWGFSEDAEGLQELAAICQVRNGVMEGAVLDSVPCSCIHTCDTRRREGWRACGSGVSMRTPKGSAVGCNLPGGILEEEGRVRKPAPLYMHIKNEVGGVTGEAVRV
jgi:hypothetical protein